MLSFGIMHAPWDTTIFVSSKFFKHDQKNAKSWEKVCLTTIFIRSPKKPFYKLENCLFFFSPLFQTIMDKSLGTLLHFWGVFRFTQVLPLPTRHKQCWTRVSRIFCRVSTLYRVGGGRTGRTGRNFRKGCTVLRGNREMTEKYEYCSTVPRTFLGPG